MRPGNCECATGRDVVLVEVADLEAHVGAVLAEEDVRICALALDAEHDEPRQSLRIGCHVLDVDAFTRERFAHEAAHVLVADAGQHRAAQAEAGGAGGEVRGGAAEILGEALHVFEPAADLLRRTDRRRRARGRSGRTRGSSLLRSAAAVEIARPPERRVRLHRPRVLGGELGHGVRLVRQMPDHPGVVHPVARRRALRMIETGGNFTVSYCRTLTTSSPSSAWP